MALIAHICDVHFGARIGRVFPEDIERWWGMMIGDWRNIPHKIEIALVCGDVTADGTEEQLNTAKRAIESLEVETYVLPGEIDVAGGKGRWVEKFGDPNRLVRCSGLNILIVDFLQHDEKQVWTLTREQIEWLDKCFRERDGEPFLLAIQPPFEKHEGMFRPPWDRDLIEGLLERLKRVDLVCVLSSGMHTNREALVNGLYAISTGALCGFRMTGTPPEGCILTRPGYRLIAIDDGVVRTFWREIASPVQVTINFIGGSHTLGPRPQVNVIDVYGDCSIHVQAYAQGAEITSVKIGFGGSPWMTLRKIWDGIWSEWEGEIHTYEIGWGQQVLVARAAASNGEEAYDAVPFWMRSLPSHSATSVREVIVFELLHRPR